MSIFKQIFCKHVYTKADEYLVNSGMCKVHIFICKKCGKRKVVM